MVADRDGKNSCISADRNMVSDLSFSPLARIALSWVTIRKKIIHKHNSV